jgi:arylformamidase
MIIDISQPLRPGMARFSGDAPYEESSTFVIGPSCPVNVARLGLSVHCGSHADAPLHYAAEGQPVGELSLDPFIGACRIIDARAPEPLAEITHIASCLDRLPPRVLLRLMETTDPQVWPAGFRALSETLIDSLAERGVRLIGVDTPSIDPETSRDLPAHKAALRHDIRILENLVLSHVTPGDYELIALPLRLANLDASPVRAILRPLPPSRMA